MGTFRCTSVVFSMVCPRDSNPPHMQRDSSVAADIRAAGPLSLPGVGEFTSGGGAAVLANRATCMRCPAVKLLALQYLLGRNLSTLLQ
jgi:hypothetical protein